jgi:hybrid polyketide synthase/nonribosomal peptide synthetase ACE1
LIIFILLYCSLTPFRNAAVGNTNLQALHKIGESLPSLVGGKANTLETAIENDFFSKFYTNTFGIQFYLRQLGRVAGQISNRFPHVNILELGRSQNPFYKFL